MTESQKSWATRLFQETWEAKTRTMERRGFASPKAVSWARERQKQRRAAGGSGNHFAMALEPVVKNPLDRGMVVDAELSAPWLTEAKYKGRRTKWREEFKAARRNYSAEDLRQAAARRVQEQSRETLDVGNEKWRWAERFVHMISPAAPEKVLPRSGTAKSDEDSIADRVPGPRDEVLDILAENAYAVAPVPLLSRPRFAMAAQRAFDLNIMSTESVSNPEHLALVKGIVDSWGQARVNDGHNADGGQN